MLEPPTNKLENQAINLLIALPIVAVECLCEMFQVDLDDPEQKESLAIRANLGVSLAARVVLKVHAECCGSFNICW